MSTYIKTHNIQIKDGDQWVDLKGVLKNDKVSNWRKIVLSNDQELIVTTDHPFVTNEGKTIADDLLVGTTLFTCDNEVEVISNDVIELTEDSYDVETSSGMFTFNNIKSYNCRTQNGFDINGLGQQKDGRGNICPVTIILPTLAMETKEKLAAENPNYTEEELVDSFIEYFDTKLHEAKDMLIERFNWICKQPMESARFMYENNLMAGYDPKEGIKSALKHGTLTIGMIALAETLQILAGTDQTSEKGAAYADRIVNLHVQRCAEFKEQYKLNFATYWTPAESLCHTALKNFRKKYGVIKNVSDREYFTNSMHTPVWHECTPFEKIDIESRWANKGFGGTITYVELPSTTKHNIDALETLVNYAMDKDIPYFAVNLKLDYCENCGYQDELGETCPKCGSNNITRLRRVTGYLTGNYKTAFNWGKQKETEDRVTHVKH